MKKMLKIEMLSTGDEVLYGQIIDTNAAWLSDIFFQDGFTMRSRFTVGDNLDQLVDALQQRTAINDILIVNGGLGPTSDDLSAAAAAKANNEVLILHKEWLTEMEKYFSSRGRPMSPSNLKQAMLPQSATIINNPVGTACGFKMVINDCTVFFTPGVPSEFKEMVKFEILPYLRKKFPDIDKLLCYRLTTMGRSESDLAGQLENQLLIPDDISLGYRSAMPIIELKLTGPQTKKEEMDRLWTQIQRAVMDNTLYEGTIGLPNLVSNLLTEKSLSISIIEQYTSGLMAYQLYEAQAPLLISEVTPSYGDKCYMAELYQNAKSDILLGLVNFRDHNNQFTLILMTPQKQYQYHLKYVHRKHNRATEQAIFTAIGLDMLRRYMLGLPLVGPNIWLEVISETIS